MQHFYEGCLGTNFADKRRSLRRYSSLADRGQAVISYDVFWVVTPCGSRKHRSFGQTCRFHLQGRKNTRARKVLKAFVLTNACMTPQVPNCNCEPLMQLYSKVNQNGTRLLSISPQITEQYIKQAMFVTDN
jgi:hypothetical protein